MRRRLRVRRAHHHVIVQAEAHRAVRLRVVPRWPHHHKRAAHAGGRRAEDLVHRCNHEPGRAACGGLRPSAHDGVGVEVDAWSEDATDATEGVVEPREVCGRVHPQQLLRRRVGLWLVDAE